jgi:hypothetical protein
MIFLSVQEPPKLPPLIEIIIQTPQETEIPPPVTWRDNPQGCNEATHWIAAEEPFYCIEKPGMVQSTTFDKKPVRTAPVRSQASPGAGWYPVGQCTWWVWTKRPVGFWNDATDWKWQAIRDGYSVSDVPVAGAIAWTYGHVAYVESVNSDGSVNISEANYDSQGSIRYVTVSRSSYTYIY